MKKFFLRILIIVLLFLPFFSQAASISNLSVKPTQLNVATTPGSSVSGEIILKNESEKKIEINCQAQDIISSLTGTSYGLLEENDPYSVARWIKFEKQNFKIPAKDTLKIPYKVEIPYGVRKGNYWGIIFFNLPNEQNSIKDEKESSVSVSGRIGVKVFVSVLELKKAEVIDFKVAKFISDYKNVKLILRAKNLGSVNISPEGKINIEGISYKPSFSFNQLNPGEEKEIILDFSSPIAFKKLNASLDFEHSQVKGDKKISFWVFPIYYLSIFVAVTLILIIFSLVIYLKFIKKRKNKKKKKREVNKKMKEKQ